MSAKKKTAGAAFLSLDGPHRSTPKGEVWGRNPRGHFVSTDPRSTVPLVGFNRVSSEEEMVSSGG
jgi:hypothetical protein